MSTKESLLSKRVRDLRESLLQIQPRLSCERLRCLAEVYQDVKGEAPVTTRAKVFEKLLKEMTIFIDENPIVGTLTQYRAGVQPYPEASCKWMMKEYEYSTALGKGRLSDDDKRLLAEAIDYWGERCLVSKADEMWQEKYPGLKRSDFDAKAGAWMPPNSAVINTFRCSVDYGRVVHKGLKEVIKEAQNEIQALPLVSLEAFRKRDFLGAVIRCLNAVIAFAKRYADLADSMANKEMDPDRKKELQKIAATCRWVPENQARNFYEAVQSFWFTHLATEIEGVSGGHSPVRFPQYMYPFYKKDKENGTITEEEAIELLELLFIKFSEINIYQGGAFYNAAMSNLFQNMNLGGVTPDGNDATNELDFMILEAQRRVRMMQPTLSVLYHDKMSEEFLLKALELVRIGIGMPAFFNCNLNIQRSLSHGASLEDARNHCIVGCIEQGYSHSNATVKDGWINMAKILELALYDGKDPLTGKQLGLQTGNAEAFTSYNELHEAVKKQFQYQFQLYFEYEFGSHSYLTEYFPAPFTSALINDCIKRGKDVNGGGARYEIDGISPCGMIDLADSLTAVKKLVFEEKKVTMKDLIKALRADFEGYEQLHKICLEAPKYGNDDIRADQTASDWFRIFEQEQSGYKNHVGAPLRAFALSVTTHFPFGVRTGALPNGRKKGVPLADGSVSASPGMDRNGPTALINSACRVADNLKYGSNLLNMKFHPVALKDRAGLRKLLSLIKTYVDLGGHHVQFNVVGADTLKDAQLHPEEYRDLIVRVAGFSAYFIHLDPVVQNEIIKRTEIIL